MGSILCGINIITSALSCLRGELGVGIVMVTRILPAPPAARERALFLNPLTLMTLGKSILRYLPLWSLYCITLLVIVSRAFKGQSDNFSTDGWARLPRGWPKNVCISTALIHRGDDLQFTVSGNHISDKCRVFF